MGRLRIICADVLDGLAQIESESVQCVVTSPPYYGLRDYQAEGQIGLEKTFLEYISRMVGVFREVRRVLRKDGTLWLNMGDSYASGKGTCYNPGGGPKSYIQEKERYQLDRGNKSTLEAVGVKPKDLLLLPHRLAIALCDDGWWVRSDIVWSKPNPMPESVTDRPTRSHEYVFLLTKSARYYYDAEAIKEISEEPDRLRCDRFGGANGHLVRHDEQTVFDTRRGHANAVLVPYGIEASGAQSRHGVTLEEEAPRGSRNKRSVWTIPTQPYPEAHFATFPEDLVKPCVLAGSKAEDTVLDPFMGSGTTGLVAMQYGRNFVGIELNPEYVKLAEKRLHAAVSQELLKL